MRIPPTFALLPFLAATAVSAHSLYILPADFYPQGGDSVIFSIHNGDSFPMSEEAADPNRITTAQSICGDTVTPVVDFKKLGRAIHGAAITAGTGACWVTVSTSSRELEMAPDKFEAYLREEGLDAVVAWRADHEEASKPGRERYRKFAKSLLKLEGAIADSPSGPSTSHDVMGFLMQPLGLEIEFIPEVDPSTLKPGDNFPVRVLRDGKPLAGVRVESAWAVDGTNGVNIVGHTDQEGRISVPLDRLALWRLHAVTMERLSNIPEADWHSYWASLTFEIR